MSSVLKSCLKQFPLLVKIKRGIWSLFAGSRGDTENKILFPLYRPHSAGHDEDKAALTIQTINQIFPFLSALSESINGKLLPVEDIAGVPKTDQDRLSARALKERLDFHGSDKATSHNYHLLYGTILRDKDAIENIFELGLGTNQTDIVSTMGAGGKPGASLRAFRDYCSNANVYGADIDKRILFKENRIQTYFVDQTDPKTFGDLLAELPRTFDLVIDDGLHSPDANVESLRFGLGIVKKGGWVVIEDIAGEAISLWQVVAALLPKHYEPHLYNAVGGIVFAVQRLN